MIYSNKDEQIIEWLSIKRFSSEFYEYCGSLQSSNFRLYINQYFLANFIQPGMIWKNNRITCASKLRKEKRDYIRQYKVYSSNNIEISVIHIITLVH